MPLDKTDEAVKLLVEDRQRQHAWSGEGRRIDHRWNWASSAAEYSERRGVDHELENWVGLHTDRIADCDSLHWLSGIVCCRHLDTHSLHSEILVRESTREDQSNHIKSCLVHLLDVLDSRVLRVGHFQHHLRCGKCLCQSSLFGILPSDVVFLALFVQMEDARTFVTEGVN